MDLISEAKRIIDIFDDKNKSMDFTMYLENIKSGNMDLYKAILSELSSGNYKVRYLNSTGVMM